jgi:hypothetical protein
MKGQIIPYDAWENLQVAEYGSMLQGNMKAFADFTGSNYPHTIRLEVSPVWLLRSQFNQTQQLDISVEVTYFNGTAFKKVVQLFQIKLIGDNDNTFETATVIAQNETVRGSIGYRDLQDFFKVLLTSGDQVSITFVPPDQTNLVNLFFYSADHLAPVFSTNDTLAGGTIHYTIDSTGWWFIKVQTHGASGKYTLKVEFSR